MVSKLHRHEGLLACRRLTADLKAALVGDAEFQMRGVDGMGVLLGDAPANEALERGRSTQAQREPAARSARTTETAMPARGEQPRPEQCRGGEFGGEEGDSADEQERAEDGDGEDDRDVAGADDRGATAEAALAPAPMADKQAAPHIGHLATSEPASAGNQATRASAANGRADRGERAAWADGYEPVARASVARCGLRPPSAERTRQPLRSKAPAGRMRFVHTL